MSRLRKLKKALTSSIVIVALAALLFICSIAVIVIMFAIIGIHLSWLGLPLLAAVFFLIFLIANIVILCEDKNEYKKLKEEIKKFPDEVKNRYPNTQ